MISAPCFECKSRRLYCHARCEQYIEYQVLKKDINEARKSKSRLDGDILKARKRFTGRIIKEM